MCFSGKLLMDCVLLLVLMPVVLTASTSTKSGNDTESTPTTSTTASTPPIVTCGTPNKPNIVTLPPVVGRIKVKWDKTNPCQGYIYFSINFTDTERHLCYSSILAKKLSYELCKERRCGGLLGYMEKSGKNSGKGYMIHENLTATSSSSCDATFLTCKDADNNELVAYKVITGLLLTLIIVVIFCRFVQPVYISVRKRFSQKRQDRWIGPTQTQSVSYHRGQANHPNNNTKRHSYPGLERLSVNPSREPSSNRNSDYDSYGG